MAPGPPVYLKNYVIIHVNNNIPVSWLVFVYDFDAVDEVDGVGGESQARVGLPNDRAVIAARAEVAQGGRVDVSLFQPNLDDFLLQLTAFYLKVVVINICFYNIKRNFSKYNLNENAGARVK